MSTVISILEDHRGNVIGVETDEGTVMADPADVVPRSQLGLLAAQMESKYQVAIPKEWSDALAARLAAAKAAPVAAIPGQ